MTGLRAPAHPRLRQHTHTCHTPIGLRLLQELHLLVHAGTGLQLLHHHLRAVDARAHLPQEHLRGRTSPPALDEALGPLCPSPYSSAKRVLDPSRGNPPGCAQHSLAVLREEEGLGRPTRAGGQGEAGSKMLPPVPCPQPSGRHLPMWGPGTAEKGLQAPSSPERGPAGWRPGALPGEAGLYLLPPPPWQDRGPRCQPPTPRSATHLPKPAAANLLQVEEAVAAQVCGLEQLHC